MTVIVILMFIFFEIRDIRNFIPDDTFLVKPVLKSIRCSSFLVFLRLKEAGY